MTSCIDNYGDKEMREAIAFIKKRHGYPLDTKKIIVTIEAGTLSTIECHSANYDGKFIRDMSHYGGEQ